MAAYDDDDDDVDAMKRRRTGEEDVGRGGGGGVARGNDAKCRVWVDACASFCDDTIARRV